MRARPERAKRGADLRLQQRAPLAPSRGPSPSRPQRAADSSRHVVPGALAALVGLAKMPIASLSISPSAANRSKAARQCASY